MAESSSAERSSEWLATGRQTSRRECARADPHHRGSVHADQPKVQRLELSYGSREFRAASELARRLPYSPSIWGLIGGVLRDPVLIRAFIAIWQLPVVDLRIRRADAEAWSDATPVGRSIIAGRRAQAVLELPTAEGRYLAGRPRQALRTNLRHASKLGMTSGRVPGYEEWLEAAGVILRARPDGPAMAAEMNKPEPGQQVAYYVTRDADGSPLAFARVALLGQFAVLFTLLSHPDRRPSASWARYQLHTLLALELGCSGVKHLIVGSALRETSGNQYFQHLLGYRVCNLRIRAF